MDSKYKTSCRLVETVGRKEKEQETTIYNSREKVLDLVGYRHLYMEYTDCPSYFPEKTKVVQNW